MHVQTKGLGLRRFCDFFVSSNHTQDPMEAAKHCMYLSISAEYDVDFYEVLTCLIQEQTKCYEIGTALKVKQSALDRIEKECLLDYNKALRKVIAESLKRNYDTERYGPPTWKALVEAVKSPIGGDNAALAEKIAKDHPPHRAASPLQVSMHVRNMHRVNIQFIFFHSVLDNLPREGQRK